MNDKSEQEVNYFQQKRGIPKCTVWSRKKVENVNSQEEEHINNLSNNDNSRYVYITVTLTCAKNGKRMKTRALVDTGNTAQNQLLLNIIIRRNAQLYTGKTNELKIQTNV